MTDYPQCICAEKHCVHDQLDEQSATIQRLERDLRAMTGDRDLWQEAHDDDCPNVNTVTTLEAELATARETVERLKKYATHRQGCPASFMAMSNEHCTCGLDAALTQIAATEDL